MNVDSATGTEICCKDCGVGQASDSVVKVSSYKIHRMGLAKTERVAFGFGGTCMQG